MASILLMVFLIRREENTDSGNQVCLMTNLLKFVFLNYVVPLTGIASDPEMQEIGAMN
jgi:hypothetical protein